METINTHNAPEAIGPYSQAIKVGTFLFVSGQIGLSPDSKILIGDDIASQTEQVFKNITAILEDAGATLSHVVKTTVFLHQLTDFPEMNQVYEQAFGNHKPARTTVAVTELPRGALVEIDCIAVVQ